MVERPGALRANTLLVAAVQRAAELEGLTFQPVQVIRHHLDEFPAVLVEAEEVLARIVHGHAQCQLGAAVAVRVRVELEALEGGVQLLGDVAALGGHHGPAVGRLHDEVGVSRELLRRDPFLQACRGDGDLGGIVRFSYGASK